MGFGTDSEQSTFIRRNPPRGEHAPTPRDPGGVGPRVSATAAGGALATPAPVSMIAANQDGASSAGDIRESFMNVTQGLRRVLQTNPEGIATVDGERRRNWRETAERVARLAGALQHLGVKRGDRVAVLTLNSDRYLELYFGIAWAGAVIVPLNIRWSPVENEDAMHDCRAGSWSSTGLLHRLARTGESVAGLKLIYADDGNVRGRPRAGYETLLPRSEPVAGRDASSARPRRHLLHRRHHRPLQGRDAQPWQPRSAMR